MEDIYSGKSIWDDDSSDWIGQLMYQAEEEAREMQEKEEREKYFSEQQKEEEEYNNQFLMEDEEDDFMNKDIVPIKNTSNYLPKETEGFQGIYKVEGARTGQPTNLNSSAIGRGQMIKGTRYAMYKKLGINNIEEAEQQYRSNPEFEEVVNNAYREELNNRIPSNIQGKEREYMIAKGWYTGNPFYDDNKVPHPEAGNKLTAGEYARRAVRQYGGGFIPSGLLKQAQFGITYNGIVPNNLDADYHYNDGSIDLDEVEVRGKRNNSEQTLLNTPLSELEKKYNEMKQKQEENKFYSGIPEKSFDLINGISKFEKTVNNRFFDTINNHLDNTISSLSNVQNDNNLREYEKLLNQNKYNSVRQNQNKQTPYI